VVLAFLLAQNAFAILIETVKYDELSPLGPGVTDGLGFIWRFKWNGKAGDLQQGPTGPLPDSQTFWQSSVLFSVPESGDEPKVIFFSKSHKRPDAVGHLGDADRTQVLKFRMFETALFTNNTLGEGTHHLDQQVIDHPSNSLGKHKDFVFVDFIKSDGELFFEMRGEHVLVSESSAIALFLLGFIGLFSRRWP
jgi:hypothetical protein